jgi:hypothetical protein
MNADDRREVELIRHAMMTISFDQEKLNTRVKKLEENYSEINSRLLKWLKKEDGGGDGNQ